ncbi:gfo/Idh/MocA family oxidoreductase [Helicobacter cholecystus]|uniref:Gfo/Idh/MocA family oxidoreductase n=1 Tax=Helicobacter cholecystus TaxID=45498 RepID=A0A3D8IX83_9HELI|nr:Gfo/Idh/MocA family oxidoreductase [Helicobacter cholecystus]RDU69576.1 gfo/Idh/MocA family oxidoreductase [Helicobacter cholecystus]VEJ24133.1 oxidoreductase [Helicobacter cholecystus]
MKRFAVIGVGGYVAPRHLKAIKDCGGNVLCAIDKHDSVGIMDSFFPHTHFFTEFERFDRHIDKLHRQGKGIEFFSICSPNYLHDSHIRYALKNGSDAICEKPLVLNPWNLEALLELEKESGKKVYNILQLRLHPKIIALKENVEQNLKQNPHCVYEIDLSYITSRGNWYFTSWKGDKSKSGGIASNIGIHFFDMLLWIFGKVKRSELYFESEKTMVGYLELEHAKVRWFLSVDATTLPQKIQELRKPTYRSLKINQEEFEFSEGFTDLHTLSYEDILNGGGFSAIEAQPSIELVYALRHAPLSQRDSHTTHPFFQ